MEDRTRTPNETGNDALFSERVRLWLDEGERLEAEAAAAPEAAQQQGPAPAELGPVRRLFARHRLGVLAGMGLLPLALFAALHRGSVPPVPPVAIGAASAPVTAPVPPAPAPPAAPAPGDAPPPAVAAVEPGVAEPGALEEPTGRQGRRHHHHHHRRTAHHRSTFHR
jgi:hypothetical protein